MKFGKIDIENLKMTHYEKDSSVGAVVLYDYGVASVKYNSVKNNFQLVFDKHIRIKVFNKSGYKWANENVYLYHKSGNKEKITRLKGATYNLENYKVVKSNLNAKSVFEEEFDNNNDVKKFTMPNVKEGCIIEYSYTILSDFVFNFQDWEFQKSIPVIWSEFRSATPEYFNYQKIIQGFLAIDNYTTDQNIIKINLTVKNTALQQSVKSTIANESDGRDYSKTISQEYIEYRNRWIVENAPSFIEEPFMTSRDNFISKIKFQLANIEYPNEPIISVMGSWNKLNQQYLESELFGKKVQGSYFLKDVIDLLISNQKDDLDKISAIYDFIKKNIVWNGQNRKLLKTNLKKPFDDKIGSSAEINLLLTSMLQKAGFNANPVLVSTRDHGLVRKDVSLSKQFNYVICKLELNDGYILLDATDRYLPMGLLPERCLNGYGWEIAKNNPGWVNLKTEKKAHIQVTGNINISKDGVSSGEINFKFGDYSARDPRKIYLENGVDKYIENKISESSWEIDNLKLENASDVSTPFIEKYTIDELIISENLGGRIYLNVMVTNIWEENPFRLEKREYPVDFAFPLSHKYYVVFTIPEGYAVESLPNQKTVTLPERTATFNFSAIQAGNKITVITTLYVNKTFFDQYEYPFLKEFFAEVMAKQKEQIILKKI